MSDLNKGIFYLRNFTADGDAEYWLLRDVSSPSSAALVEASVCDVAGLSSNLDRLVFSKRCSNGLDDLFAVSLDPTTGKAGKECDVSAGSLSATTFALRSMTDNGRWLFWTDNIDTSIGIGDGKLTDLGACKTTDFGKNVQVWDPVERKGFIEADDWDGAAATIRIVDLTSGTAPPSPTSGVCTSVKDGGDCMAQLVNVIYDVPAPAYDKLVFTIDENDPASDGGWVFTKFPASWSGP